MNSKHTIYIKKSDGYNKVSFLFFGLTLFELLKILLTFKSKRKLYF